MLTRQIIQDIHHYLQHFPSLLITGARQVGKSTLALSLGIEQYITLDDIATYQSVKADPKGFVKSLTTPIIIDEVQRAPELFVAIKEQIDLDRSAGRYILTGSSNLQGFKNLSDSLAGRIGIVDLYAFSLSELYGHDFSLIDWLFSSNDYPSQPITVDVSEHIIKGGFPELQTIDHDKTRLLWFSSYIRTYIERDLHDVSNIRNLDSFMRLYLALAYRSGSLLNKQDLGNDCQIDAKTLDNYLSILNNTYQISLVKPYFSHAMKRLVKMPKLFMLDTGILCHLLKVNSTTTLANSVNKGAIYETFVLSELVKAMSYATEQVDLSFYRTSDGKEIDFILDNGQGLIVIEVKSSYSVKAADFKWIRQFITQQPERVKQAIVLYAGDRALPFGDEQGVKLWAVPLGFLAGG